MTGSHYQWHKRWRVDIEAASATHESGLIARFVALPLSEPQMQAHDAAGDAAIGKCWTRDGREWGVICNGALMQKTFEQLSEKNGAHNAQAMVARLAREAGEVWVWEKNRDH